MTWLILFLALLFAPIAANAHPHAWIDYQTHLIFDKDGKFIALKEHWIFTEDYTEFMRHDFDKNKNGKLDHDELMFIANATLKNLHEYHYFTDVKVNDKKIAFQTATDVDSSIKDKKIVMDFTLNFTKPVNPAKDDVYYKIYDPSFFTDMRHTKTDGINLVGARESCGYNLIKAKVSPALIAEAMNIDKNGQAPMGLGEFMAEKVTVNCK